MKKKLFFLLVLLMSLSLIGIIFVQGFWIKNTVDSKEAQFSFNAKQVLISVSDQLEENEFESYYFQFLAKAENKGKPDKVTIENLWQVENGVNGNNTFIYSNSVIQEDYKLFSPFLRGTTDSINFKKFTNRQQVTRIVRKDQIEGKPFSAKEQLIRITQADQATKTLLSGAVQKLTIGLPLYKRVDKKRVEELIDFQLRKRDIDSDYEFAFFSNGMATKIQSDNFTFDLPSTYAISIFDTNDGSDDHNYQLMINFTDKKKEVLSSIVLMGSLSIIFTLVIVVAYASALTQLNKQRQISQIKTDFINNMTHEFKTPIATINLALDAVGNSKIQSDEEKRNRYLRMIREENKRMHAQVENVLRISKLERNELDIGKERVDLHDLIEDAISHIELIVENRQGYVKSHLDAKKSHILANESHFTNIIINILDNAVKYSANEPEIDVFTENVKNYVILKIQDRGIGMHKGVQRKVFEKFFREHTGDVHNVKGHGLGLAYVKRILEDHHGEISVLSTKGKGSTFIIKLPLIS